MNGCISKLKKSRMIIICNTVRIILAVIVVLTFMSSLLGSSVNVNAAAKPFYKKDKVIVAWYDASDFQEKDDNGRRFGYGYDYLSVIAGYAGWELEFIEGDIRTFMLYFSGELREENIPKEWGDKRPDIICGIEKNENLENFLRYPDLAMDTESYYIFAADNEDDMYLSNDYLHNPNISISVTKGSITESKLKNWKEKNRYSFKIKGIVPDIEKDLTAQEIRFNDLKKNKDDPLRIADLTADTGKNVLKTDGLSPLRRVGTTDRYIAVRPGKNKLIDELNEVQSKLLITDPYFTEELTDAYFSNTAVRNVLTAEEKLWIRNTHEVKVGFYDGYVPFTNYEDGTMKGLYADLLKYLRNKFNVDISIKYIPYTSYNKMLKDLADKRIDVAAPVYTSTNDANELGILISKPLIDTSMFWVYKDDDKAEALNNDAGDEELCIALSEDSPLQKSIFEDYYSKGNKTILYVSDWKESLKNVENGNADGTLLNAYRVNINLRNSHKLKTKEVVAICKLSWGVRSDMPELLSILNRSIFLYGKGNASESLLRHSEEAYKTTFEDFIKENYLWFNSLVVVAFMMVCVMIAYILFKRKQKAILENMARRDSVTGLRNRRSYDEDIVKLSDNQIDPDLVVAVMDIDELKKINDLYGHAAGDEAIKGAASCINNTIEAYGRVYKASGDEFFAIFSASHEEYERIKKEIAGKLAIWKGEYVKKLSVSYGYVEHREYPNADIKELMKIADERMYTQKFNSGYAYRIKSKDGRVKNVEGYGYLLHNQEDANLLEAFVNAYEAQYDTLTGLPSMSHFLDTASSMDNEILRNDGMLLMVSFNFNGLKSYNDKFGLQVGNDLLISLAVILEESFGKNNCSRFGEDHFFAFTTDKIFDSKIDQLIEDIAKINNGNSLPMRIGVYPYDEDDIVSPSTACDRAQVAGEHARKSTETKIIVYDDKIKYELQMKDFIINNIDKAIAEGHIKAFYQPKINTVDESLCGFEALARWIDPEKGMISPGIFIPILEDFNLTWKVDHHILQQVASDIIKVRKMGLEVYPVSFNISRTDFIVTDPYENLIYTVKLYGLTRNLFNVEITESSVMDDPQGIREQVQRFKKSGFEVLMDDFGSGYSSLGTLRDFDFDGIKIDMSFMRNFGERSMAIIEPMVNMAKNLGIKTIAEGVETEEQLSFLKKIGCDQIQGYYFGKPENFDTTVEIILKNS